MRNNTPEEFSEYLNTLQLYDIEAVVGFMKAYFDDMKEIDPSDKEELKQRYIKWSMVATKYGGPLIYAIDELLRMFREHGHSINGKPIEHN
jgi:DNA repair ATPase RecN